MMVSGSISFIASFTLFVMILRSADKLKTPLRRLIFGLSVSDAIASLSTVFQPLMLPPGIMGYGNQGTCNAIAFPFHLGYAAAPFYTMSLCVYYIQVIRYKRSDRDFAKRIEPWLHGISIGYPLLGSIVNLAAGNFNSSGIRCWILSQPLNCANNPDVECVRGANAQAYKWIFVTIPKIATGLSIICIMGMITWTVVKQERRNARFQFQVQSTINGGSNSFGRRLRSSISNLRSSFGSLRSSLSCCASPPESVNNDNAPAYISRSMRASQSRVRETVTQSLLYIGAFIVTYFGSFVVMILDETNTPRPFPLLVVYLIFNPLGGVFNILVYTRPKVSAVRRRRPEYWWFRAFWMVVMTGGDMPKLPRRTTTDSSTPSNITDISAVRRATWNNTDVSTLRRTDTSILRRTLPEAKIDETADTTSTLVTLGRSPLAPYKRVSFDGYPVLAKTLEPGEEEFDAAPAPEESLTQHEITNELPDDIVDEESPVLDKAPEQGEEEEFDAAPALEESFTQHEITNELPDDNLDESNTSFEGEDTNETLSVRGDIP